VSVVIFEEIIHGPIKRRSAFTVLAVCSTDAHKFNPFVFQILHRLNQLLQRSSRSTKFLDNKVFPSLSTYRIEVSVFDLVLVHVFDKHNSFSRKSSDS